MQHTLNLPALALPPPGNGWFLIIALLPLLRGCVTTGPNQTSLYGWLAGPTVISEALDFLMVMLQFWKTLIGSRRYTRFDLLIVFLNREQRKVGGAGSRELRETLNITWKSRSGVGIQKDDS